MFQIKLPDYGDRTPTYHALSTQPRSDAILVGLTTSRYRNELISKQLPACVGHHGVFLVAGQAAGKSKGEASLTEDVLAYQDGAEQTSQILFGQTYKIIDISRSRKSLLIQVQSETDSPKEFLIEAHKHTYVDREFFDRINNGKWPCLGSSVTAFPICGDPQGVLKLPAGSILPFYDEETGTFAGHKYTYRIHEPAKENLFVSTERTLENVVRTMISHLGTPYDWGGLGYGLDCSGFVKRIMDPFMGVNRKLPREAKDQMTKGVTVKPSEAKTGDIIGYKRHIGILAHGEDLIRYGDPSLKWNKNALYVFHSKQLVRAEEIRADGMTTSMNPDNIFLGIRRLLPFQ